MKMQQKKRGEIISGNTQPKFREEMGSFREVGRWHEKSVGSRKIREGWQPCMYIVHTIHANEGFSQLGYSLRVY